MIENIWQKCTKTYADKCCFSYFILPSTELHVSCVLAETIPLSIIYFQFQLQILSVFLCCHSTASVSYH